MALSKTKHGTFSRTTDCVTPPYPAAPPTQQQLLGDLDDVTQLPQQLMDQSAQAQQQQGVVVGATAANQTTGGPGRMITTSIDEGQTNLFAFCTKFLDLHCETEEVFLFASVRWLRGGGYFCFIPWENKNERIICWLVKKLQVHTAVGTSFSRRSKFKQ